MFNSGVCEQQNCQDAHGNVLDSNVTVSEQDAIKPVWCSRISRLLYSEDHETFGGQQTNNTKRSCNSSAFRDVKRGQTLEAEAIHPRLRPNCRGRGQTLDLRDKVEAKILASMPRLKPKYSDNTCDQVSNKSNNAEHPSYECDKCHRTFRNHRYLKTHKRIHSSDKQYVCDLCSKSFTVYNYLTKHKRKHSGQKPYICYICNKVFTELGHLTAHVLIHTGYKRHVCDVCGKAFTNASTLTTHCRIHSGEKPYKCRMCAMSFSQSSALTLHLRTHTGERPYVCDICDKTFSNSSHLARHKRVHSGLKPYSCFLCNKSFTESSSLSTHKRMVHRCTDWYISTFVKKTDFLFLCFCCSNQIICAFLIMNCECSCIVWPSVAVCQIDPVFFTWRENWSN